MFRLENYKMYSAIIEIIKADHFCKGNYKAGNI